MAVVQKHRRIYGMNCTVEVGRAVLSAPQVWICETFSAR